MPKITINLPNISARALNIAGQACGWLAFLSFCAVFLGAQYDWPRRLGGWLDVAIFGFLAASIALMSAAAWMRRKEVKGRK